MFILTNSSNRIGDYSTAGATMNANLIGSLGGPVGITVTPEPASLALLVLGGGALLVRRRRQV